MQRKMAKLLTADLFYFRCCSIVIDFSKISHRIDSSMPVGMREIMRRKRSSLLEVAGVVVDVRRSDTTDQVHLWRKKLIDLFTRVFSRFRFFFCIQIRNVTVRVFFVCLLNT